MCCCFCRPSAGTSFATSFSGWRPQGRIKVTPTPGRKLRDAWQKETIALPGVFNALVARLAERLGFSGVYLSGAALSASLGLPDIGLVSITEFADAAQKITAACSLPLLCDADTGFGEALNV